MIRARSNLVMNKNKEQFIRFLLVGFSNFAVSFLAFYYFLSMPERLRPSVFVAQLLSYSIGTAWSFFWNRKFTFRSSNRPLGEATRFVVLQCSLAVASAAIIETVLLAFDILPIIAWILVMTGITIANYFLSRHWAFRA